MDYIKIITVEPGKRVDGACVRGAPTAVDELERLVGGMTADEILDNFPVLTMEGVRACLAHPADRERKLMITPR